MDSRGKRPRLPHGGVDRAKWTYTKAELGGENDVTGLKPHLLLWVDTSNARMRRIVTLMLRHSGVTVAEMLPQGEIGDSGHYQGLVLRVVGSGQQLECCYSHGCVTRYEYVTSARVPQGETLDEGGIPHVIRVSAQGGGPEKVRSSGPKVKPDVLAYERTIPDGETMPQTFYPPIKRVNPDEERNHGKAIEDSDNTNLPQDKAVSL